MKIVNLYASLLQMMIANMNLKKTIKRMKIIIERDVAINERFGFNMY